MRMMHWFALELGYTPEMIVAQAKRLLDGYHREGD